MFIPPHAGDAASAYGRRPGVEKIAILWNLMFTIITELLCNGHDSESTSSEASTRALKSRRNELAPISRLPPETLATIFTFLSASAWNERDVYLEWIRVAHVCRRWREAALDHPRFWSHINFTKLTPAGMAEILTRAKMAPLHLEADVSIWRTAQVEAFERQLEAHISHTRHLSLSGSLQTAFARLLSSAPTLESLSLSHKYQVYGLLPVAIVPDNLLNCTAPNLTSLELENCDISWKSPLLKGLRNLQILDISTKARPKFEDWLDALNEMSNLQTLSLQSATPLAPLASPLIPGPSRAITLPSLTHFRIHASAKDCALALAHLLLPALTRLHVDVDSYDEEGEDVRLVIPYVARNVYVQHDIEPIRSILIAGERTCTDVLTWTRPGADIKVCGPNALVEMSSSACLVFAAKGKGWNYGVDAAIFDALLTLLPVNFVLTFTAQNRARLSKEFWLSHAPRHAWFLTQSRHFTEMLAEDIPPDGPRLPSLTKLTLVDVTLTALRTYHLLDLLIKRVEQGVPLEVLDLRTCVAADRAIQLLAEIVVDVQEPLDAPQMVIEEFEFFKHVECCDEIEYDDGRKPWYGRYGDMDDDEGEDEDEGYDDEFDYNEELEYQLYDEDDTDYYL
ncbi:hypothetical protein F5888DRAFT_1636895 [Russula emetica]|nr:hypothetical protein F5888DRAFT_1636895 [Russula emetica]